MNLKEHRIWTEFFGPGEGDPCPACAATETFFYAVYIQPTGQPWYKDTNNKCINCGHSWGFTRTNVSSKEPK